MGALAYILVSSKCFHSNLVTGKLSSTNMQKKKIVFAK